MTLDPEAYYHHLGRIIETMPKDMKPPHPPEVHRWLGQADALVSQSEDMRDTLDWRNAVGYLGSDSFRAQYEDEMRRILYRTLASAELKAPARVKGTFIPTGSGFDAFASVSKILQSATQDVFIVDPYLDE